MFQWISGCNRNALPHDLLGFFRVNRGSKAFGVHEELSEKHNEKESPRLCFRFMFPSFPASIFEAIFAYFSSKNTPKKSTFLRKDLRCAIWAHFHAKKPPKSSQNHPKTHPKRHTKNEERFHSTFERFPAQNGTKKAPESKAKTMPKTDAKNEGRGKPTP